MPATELRPRAAWRLADWLAYQERLHPKLIELGLDRVREVGLRLDVLPASAITLTIAGTNGKGSSVVLAGEIYKVAGYRVGRYMSPHLLRYNERIAIGSIEVSDDALCAAFEAVEQARAGTTLTYFEFGTLAALWLFREARVDVQVLEVGLGGRLDAVNIVDTDCALITNIGLDHLDWLGKDRESIGFEKAGILRARKPAVCVQTATDSIANAAASLDIKLMQIDRDFSFEVRAENREWNWCGSSIGFKNLPAPGLLGHAQYINAAGVLAAIEALQARLPVDESAIRCALSKLRLPGRYERVGNVILDVAHNAEAAAVLAENLRADGWSGRIHLVLGMLSDKPVEAVCAVLAPLAAKIWFGSLPSARGLTADQLHQRAAAAGIEGNAAGTIEDAYRQARTALEAGTDCAPSANQIIVVCGSFLSVAAIAGILNE